MRKDGKFKETSSVVIVSERAGEHCQTKRVLSQHQSSFLPRQLGRATSLSLTPPLPSSLLPFSLGFSLLLTHMLSPPSLHTCVCSPSFSLQIWAIASYFLLSALPLPSLCHELAPFQQPTAAKKVLEKSVGLGLEHWRRCLCVNWERRNGTCWLLHPSRVEQKPRCIENQ